MTTGALLRRVASRSTRILAGEPYTGFLTTDAGRCSATKDARCHVNVSRRRVVSRGDGLSAIGYQLSVMSYQSLLVLAVSPTSDSSHRLAVPPSSCSRLPVAPASRSLCILCNLCSLRPGQRVRPPGLTQADS